MTLTPAIADLYIAHKFILNIMDYFKTRYSPLLNYQRYLRNLRQLNGYIRSPTKPVMKLGMSAEPLTIFARPL